MNVGDVQTCRCGYEVRIITKRWLGHLVWTTTNVERFPLGEELCGPCWWHERLRESDLEREQWKGVTNDTD